MPPADGFLLIAGVPHLFTVSSASSTALMTAVSSTEVSKRRNKIAWKDELDFLKTLVSISPCTSIQASLTALVKAYAR